MKLPPTASSSTECKNQPLLFQDLGSRKVVADFSGGTLSSDGGVLLLQQVDRALGLTRRLASCFGDQRHQVFVEHSVPELLAQRIYAEALGYEDINDHQELRRDPLLATACGKNDPLGQDRIFHPGPALAAPSTLNRLELSNNKHTRCHKVPHDPKKIEALLLELGVRCLPKHAAEIVIDLDAMGHRLHGSQEGRHFNRYYDDYVYLPLYVFVGNIPLWAQVRTCEHEAAHGVVPALERIVSAIRRRCKKARLMIRGDSGFCRDEIMTWCESQPEVYYCLGLGKNSVLLERAERAMMDARARCCLTGGASTRIFTEFEYQTKTETWSRARRVVAKAEVTAEGDNSRFIVTNLPAAGFKKEKDRTRFTAARLYEELYCARGEMENVLKQQVLDLKADRMSTHHMASNQLRLWLATFAYLLMERVRTWGLYGTELAKAMVGSVRLKLFKVAAQVSVSVRRVYVQLSSAYPLQEIFRLCQRRLMGLPLWSD
ncbi:MAG: IS1380 family transposase [Acidobacteria bacterium]|nr:IS1380 family transposase [Acidobacteriota bacterium]